MWLVPQQCGQGARNNTLQRSLQPLDAVGIGHADDSSAILPRQDAASSQPHVKRGPGQLQFKVVQCPDAQSTRSQGWGNQAA